MSLLLTGERDAVKYQESFSGLSVGLRGTVSSS